MLSGQLLSSGLRRDSHHRGFELPRIQEKDKELIEARTQKKVPMGKYATLELKVKALSVDFFTVLEGKAINGRE